MIIILHNIRSIYNVASIFRTADAVGVEKIFLCGITPTPIDEMGRFRKDFLKVSLGREKTLAWEKKKSTVHLIQNLKKAGYIIFSVEQDTQSIPYYKIKIKNKNLFKKVVLILGHERKGLSRNILSLSKKILEVPMESKSEITKYPIKRNKKESLNVAIVFAIVAFHLRHHTPGV